VVCTRVVPGDVARMTDEKHPRRTYNRRRNGPDGGKDNERSMPTLLVVEGYRFYFFSLEANEPPHVHVRRGGGKAKLWLEPVRLDYSRGFKSQELKRIHELTEEHAEYFLRRWSEYLGHQ
jgi:hypothetical protein